MKAFLKAIRHPLFLLGIILISLSAGGYLYYQYTLSQAELHKLKQNPQAVAKEEAKSLVAQVSELMVLPKEDPTVATVTDAKKLRNQAFFKKAENGDKVLIYTQAKQAILYRPTTDKIIEVAPVNIGQDKVAGAATTPSVTPVRIALYNGTTISGLTNTMESELKGKVSNVQFVTKENAAKNDYTQTVVVDLSGKNQQAAATFAQLLGGTVGKLPEGEKKANADILIILGQEKQE